MKFCKLVEFKGLEDSKEGRPGLSHVKEITLFLICYVVYLLTRDLFFDQSTALQNSRLIIDIERSLGILIEPSLQSWLLGASPFLLTICNWLYIITYWPVIFGISLVLYLRDRKSYYHCRNIILINLCMALVIFILIPVAPPFRSLPSIMDSIQILGPIFYGGPEMSWIYNTTAALPSLHFSWTLIFGIIFVQRVRGLYRGVIVIYPVLTLYIILVTGNHFLLDAALGAVLVAVSFCLQIFHRSVKNLLKKTAAKRERHYW